jgi:sulfatase maturation enzyme AslB (radical SAM superfamily)
MIHGGLHLIFKNNKVFAQHCCLHYNNFLVDIRTNFWKDSSFTPLREHNKKNIWAPGCENCQQLESSGLPSYRTGMNNGLKNLTDPIKGPARIDLMFDISCNLACRSCGVSSSTYWQRHLKDHGEWDLPIESPRHYNDVILALSQLDLSNLQQLVFSGGETLLGQSHWEVAEWLADNVPNAKEQLTLCFQTNGTQPIHPRNYELIERFHLVKLHISLDGTDKRFGYLRWPANWNQVTDNILNLRETLPGNVMFVIEETISIFNLLYLKELKSWIDSNFTTNREGDIVNHSRHLAGGIFNLQNMSQEYVELIKQSTNQELIPANWKENPTSIQKMVAEIKKFDALRNESFEKIFPELVNLYTKFW